MVRQFCPAVWPIIKKIILLIQILKRVGSNKKKSKKKKKKKKKKRKKKCHEKDISVHGLIYHPRNQLAATMPKTL